MKPIRIFDENLNFLTMIRDYEYLRYPTHWRKPSLFEVQINRYKKKTEFLARGNIIAIETEGVYRGAKIEDIELGLTEEGKISENLKITGYTMGYCLENRIAYHNVSLGNGYDDQNTYAEAVMRHYVDVNAINPTDINRKIPGLVLGADLGRGQTVTYRGRFQTVALILEELSILTGLGWDVTIDIVNKQFIFTVLQGKDLTPNNGVNRPVIFSPKFGNIQGLQFKESSLGTKSVAYVGGQGEANLRQITQVGTATGWARKEMFVDARDIENSADLPQRGNEALAELKDELIFEFEVLPTGPFKYLKDYNIGDIVHVEYPTIATMQSRIIEVTPEVTAQGETLKLAVGKEWPDLLKLIKRNRKNSEVEVRR